MFRVTVDSCNLISKLSQTSFTSLKLLLSFGLMAINSSSSSRAIRVKLSLNYSSLPLVVLLFHSFSQIGKSLLSALEFSSQSFSVSETKEEHQEPTSALEEKAQAPGHRQAEYV